MSPLIMYDPAMTQVKTLWVMSRRLTPFRSITHEKLIITHLTQCAYMVSHHA